MAGVVGCDVAVTVLEAPLLSRDYWTQLSSIGCTVYLAHAIACAIAYAIAYV